MTSALIVLAVLVAFGLWWLKRHNDKLWARIGKSRIKCGGVLPDSSYRFGATFAQDPNTPVLVRDPIPDFLQKGLQQDVRRTC
jgi:hypothetical protein